MSYLILILSLLFCAVSIFVSPQGADIQGCGQSQNSSCLSLVYALNISSYVELLPGTHYVSNISLSGQNNLTIMGLANDNQTIIDAGHFRLFDIFYSSIMLKNIVITNSYSSASGPALNLFNSNVTLVACVISNCASSEGGGAVYIQGGEFHVMNSSFLNNTSEQSYGGVLVIEGGAKTQFENSVFIGNKCLLWGGAVVPEGNSTNTFINCYFAYNYAECCGGAVDDGAQSKNYYSNTIFEYNRAGEGGAYYNFGEAVATFDNTRFYRNSADNTAGAIYSVSYGGLKATNTHFVENRARSGQDAVRSVNAGFFEMDSSSFVGHYGTQRFSMLSLRVLNTTIKNTTFFNNTATSDYLINFVGGDASIDSCTFIQNTAAWLIKADAIMEVRNSNFSGNDLGDSLFAVTSEGDLKLMGTSFYDNRASGNGAVATVENNVRLYATNCSFVNNVAHEGGVFDLYKGSNATIEKSLFSGNVARKGGVISTQEPFQCRDSQFYNNSAPRGGVVFISDNLRTPSANCSTWFQNCQFENNSADSGGVVLWEDRVICLQTFFNNCNYTNNDALAFGPISASSKLASLIPLRTRIEVYPGEKFSLEVHLHDDFQQIMRSSDVQTLSLHFAQNVSESFLSFDHALASKKANEAISAGVVKGVVRFVDVMMFANLGEYSVQIRADDTSVVKTVLLVVTECPDEFPLLSLDPVFTCLIDNRFVRWEYILLALIIALTVTCCLIYRASGKKSPIYWPPKLKLFLEEAALVWLSVLVELVDTVTDITLCVYSWVEPELQSVAPFYAACFVLLMLSFVLTIGISVRDLRVLQKHIRESRIEEEKKARALLMREAMRRRTTEATPAVLPTETRRVAIARMEREKTRCIIRLCSGLLEDVPMGIISLRSVATLAKVPSVVLVSLVLNCIILGIKLGALPRWFELSGSLSHLRKLDKEEQDQSLVLSTLKTTPKHTLTPAEQLTISLDLAKEKPDE